MASETGLRAGEPGDLKAALDLLRELEWRDVDKCPSCGHMHPRRATEWHGRFGHADDCKLARLIGAKRGGSIACDCFHTVAGCGGVGYPTFNGKPYAEATD